MKHKYKVLKYAEHIVVIFIWLIVFALPIFLFSEDSVISWDQVYRAWGEFIPLFIIFLINHFLLVPIFLFKRRFFFFVLSTLLVIISLGCYQYLFVELPKFPNDRKERFVHEKKMQREDGFRPKIKNEEEAPAAPFKPDDERFNDDDLKPDRLPPKRLQPNPYNFVLLTTSIGLLLIGFDTGFRLAMKWTEIDRQKAILEKENSQKQLDFLKHQISPHFFMNTLNNIHSLIDINSADAKESIMKLSHLMRYLLYESDAQFVLLSKEIEFIRSYVQLMELRFTDKVKIKLDIPSIYDNKEIPPLLFISFIENAFKHGISYKKESFVEIKFLFIDKRIIFEVKNSKTDNPVHKNKQGIGIDNTRQRLGLIFKNNYNLDITNNENFFLIKLSIPV